MCCLFCVQKSMLYLEIFFGSLYNEIAHLKN